MLYNFKVKFILVIAESFFFFYLLQIYENYVQICSLHVVIQFFVLFFCAAIRSGDYYMFDDEESFNLIQVDELTAVDELDEELHGKTLGKVSENSSHSLLMNFNLFPTNLKCTYHTYTYNLR